MNYTVLQGDCIDRLKEFPDNSVDSCATDPPYGLSKEPDINEVLSKWLAGEEYDHGHGGFMGKSWDSFVPHPDIWREVYRVLKPGGHALVFAGTRTQDLMTISLRLAGFEVRDVIEWLYFSGFPKSHDVGKAFDKREGAEREVVGIKRHARDGDVSNHSWITKDYNDTKNCYGDYNGEKKMLETAPATELARKWDGWGTALKPAHEPIIVVRKPLEGTVCDNVEKYGTGAINIDDCRIGDDEIETHGGGGVTGNAYNWSKTTRQQLNTVHKGRFPANIVTTEPDAFWSKYSSVTPQEISKKASKKDRNSDWQGEEIALDERESPSAKNTTTKCITCNKRVGGKQYRSCVENNHELTEVPINVVNRNHHPTVKPTDLMAWLVRLVTPPNGVVLDPFAGSGSTLVAAKREGFGFIGIEREPEYVEIIEARTGEEAIN